MKLNIFKLQIDVSSPCIDSIKALGVLVFFGYLSGISAVAQVVKTTAIKSFTVVGVSADGQIKDGKLIATKFFSDWTSDELTGHLEGSTWVKGQIETEDLKYQRGGYHRIENVEASKTYDCAG